MAFPVVAGSATTEGPTATLDPTVNLPASLASGDLCIVYFSSGATHGSPTVPSGWTYLVSAKPGGDTRSGDRDQIMYRWCDGGEGTTLVVDTSATAVKFSCIAVRITGANTGINPEISAAGVGSSANPDSPTLTPTGGAKDYLWLSWVSQEGENTVTGNPASYTAVTNVPTDSGGGGSAATNNRQALARRDNNTATEDPGSFTYSGSDDWVGWTIAVHPAGGGAAATHPGWYNSMGGWF